MIALTGSSWSGTGVLPVTDLPVVELAPGHAVMAADVEPPTRLSATTLRAAGKCLLASYLARHTTNPSSDLSVLGTIVHEVCSQVAFEARLRRQETFTPDGVERVAMRVLMRPERPNPLSEEALVEALGMVRRWALTAYFPVKADRYEVEIFAQHQIAGQTLSGRLDLVAITGASAEIEDWKTGRLVPTQAEFEVSTQLPTYAVYVHEDHPEVETFTLREHYLRPGVTRERVLTIADVLRHRQWLEITATRLRAAWTAQAFPPTPGKHCRYCPNPAACPLPEQARPESIDTAEQAEAQVAAAIVEKARVKIREKSIRAYLEQLGEEDEEMEVAVGDATARLDVKEGTRFDRRAAERAGVDLGEFEKPSTTRKLVISGT